MDHRFTRTEMLIGEQGVARLAAARVLIFGVGGVGSYVVESLARAGIGELILVDFDRVDVTNINRQLHAMEDTVGQYKVDLMAQRVRLINPQAKVTPLREFYSPDRGEELLAGHYSYVVDAIDNVTGKLDIVHRCFSRGIPIISSMGAGNKLDPAAFRVGDISETSVDPLARVMRRELKKRGIYKGVKVVFSLEQPIAPHHPAGAAEGKPGRLPPGSISFVPAAAGLVASGALVRDLLRDR